MLLKPYEQCWRLLADLLKDVFFLYKRWGGPSALKCCIQRERNYPDTKHKGVGNCRPKRYFYMQYCLLKLASFLKSTFFPKARYCFCSVSSCFFYPILCHFGSLVNCWKRGKKLKAGKMQHGLTFVMERGGVEIIRLLILRDVSFKRILAILLPHHVMSKSAQAWPSLHVHGAVESVCSKEILPM